jgi:hypothetical protein
MHTVSKFEDFQLLVRLTKGKLKQYLENKVAHEQEVRSGHTNGQD